MLSTHPPYAVYVCALGASASRHPPHCSVHVYTLHAPVLSASARVLVYFIKFLKTRLTSPFTNTSELVGPTRQAAYPGRVGHGEHKKPGRQSVKSAVTNIIQMVLPPPQTTDRALARARDSTAR